MKTAKEHYEEHLAAVYDWTAGGFEHATKRNQDFFSKIHLESLPRGLAVDLGSGSGFQSIPLAKLGFNVLAVDFSVDLLDELQRRAIDLSVQTVRDDILNFSEYLQTEAVLIVCMGDTLTHLRSFVDVQQLLFDASKSILENGMFVLTFRDYHSAELQGNRRFIPVRSDENKLFTCFLEYFEDFVEVHDLLYEKNQTGWKFSASSYPKLRLDPEIIVEELKKFGFHDVNCEFENGMVEITAKK